jgi:hypothetical protein
LEWAESCRNYSSILPLKTPSKVKNKQAITNVPIAEMAMKQAISMSVMLSETGLFATLKC